MLFLLPMHKYFKKLRNESSSPSNFASENSQLNQETSEQNTQTQAPNFDATPNPSSSARSRVDLSTLQSDCISFVISFVRLLLNLVLQIT